jgi:hypothetical protein
LNNKSKLINLVLFQSLWFAAILGAAQDSNIYAVTGLVIFLVIHHFTSATARSDFRLAAIAILMGLLVETTFLQSGMLVYKSAGPWEQLAPIWMLVLWANFALTINGCLDWLHGRYALAAALGAVGGPASYLGGVKLGAAAMGGSQAALLLTVSCVYAIVTPGLLFTARYLNSAHANK